MKKIKRYVDRMYTIFPFETDFYGRYHYTVEYGGNPLVDAIDARPYREETFAGFIKANDLPDKPIIALLAGSRSQSCVMCCRQCFGWWIISPIISL